MRETRVVLGVGDRGLQEEILHFLDRLPGTKVIGAADDSSGLRRMARERGADLVVGVPELLTSIDAPTLAVDLRESTAGLRAAIRVGARGYYVWPAEREALGGEV